MFPDHSLSVFRPVFVSFEGIDGSGKSTQAQMLAEALRQHGREVVLIREPGGTDLGERIRSLLLDPEMEIDPRAELLLFSAARAQLVAHVIEPALARGAIVIADRFFDSSTAYQGAGRGVASTAWLDAFHSFVTAGRSPDRTYLIDVDLETANERRGNRRADRMESGGGAFFQRVREAYLQLGESKRILVLDGTLPPDGLHRSVLADFESHKSG